MIICEYEELKNYETILKCLEHALECVEKLRKEQFPSGRHDYDGGFLLVQRGETKAYEKDSYEVHRKYIDVQYLIEGGEEVVYALFRRMKSVVPYNEADDIEFLEYEEEPAFLPVRKGMCYIAFPNDGHMPCRHKELPKRYLKIIMKLPA